MTIANDPEYAGNTPGINSYQMTLATDATATIAWDSSDPTGWTTKTQEQLDVTVGFSGVASLTCTDNGSSVTPAAFGTNPSSGAGTYDYYVPTANSGANYMSCNVVNGAAISATTPAHTFSVDTTTPILTLPASNSSYVATAPSIAVSASDSVSGIASITCANSLNSDTYTVNSSSGTIPTTDDGNGTNTWTCQALNSAGTASNMASVTVNLDSNVPVTTVPATNHSLSLIHI